MRKSKGFFSRLSRRSITFIQLAGIVLLALLYYIFSGSPSFSLEQQYRRAERAQLVGPARILGTEEAAGYYYDRFLVADDTEGIVFYCYDQAKQTRYGRLVWHEKQGDITIFPVPIYDHRLLSEGRNDDFLIAVFDNSPEAVHAELSLTLNSSAHESITADQTFQMESDRVNPGYFIFRMDIRTEEPNSPVLLGLEQFALFSQDYGASSYAVIPATVRLYNKSGALIKEHSMILRSPAAEHHTKRGNPLNP